ncbi:MAG: hypothetical protein L7S64_11380, partial [Longimicrobiales bacterium]|nr:hypothetical protein [Longimicrobiales bacterium]
NTPTVNLRALVPDRCNFKDATFKRFVGRFMERFMPGFPLGLLDTSSETAHERWEIVEDDPSEYVFQTSEMVYNGDDDRCITHYHADWNGCEETFETEDDAIDFVRERMEESRYGFPWAWNWAFLPDDRITDDELREAGFTVAHYTGGDDDTYRLCGIDGGGYAFDGAHFAPLCAIVYANRSQYGWTVETDDCHAYITLED